MFNLLFAVDSGLVVKSLDVMWKGMLAIFVAIGIIYLSVLAMIKIGKVVAEKKKQKLLAESTATDETPRS